MDERNTEINDIGDVLEGVVVSKQRRPKVAFFSVVSSPYREEIDTMLFSDGMPVKAVHTWLVDHGVTDITYQTLWRYYNNQRVSSNPPMLLEASQEMMQDSVNLLHSVVRKALEGINNGAVPRFQDALVATRLLNGMFKDLGINEAIAATEKARYMVRKLINEIVLPVLTDEQAAEIQQRISEDEEFMSWTQEVRA